MSSCWGNVVTSGCGCSSYGSMSGTGTYAVVRGSSSHAVARGLSNSSSCSSGCLTHRPALSSVGIAPGYACGSLTSPVRATITHPAMPAGMCSVGLPPPSSVEPPRRSVHQVERMLSMPAMILSPSGGAQSQTAAPPLSSPRCSGGRNYAVASNSLAAVAAAAAACGAVGGGRARCGVVASTSFQPALDSRRRLVSPTKRERSPGGVVIVTTKDRGARLGDAASTLTDGGGYDILSRSQRRVGAFADEHLCRSVAETPRLNSGVHQLQGVGNPGAVSVRRPSPSAQQPAAVSASNRQSSDLSMAQRDVSRSSPRRQSLHSALTPQRPLVQPAHQLQALLQSQLSAEQQQRRTGADTPSAGPTLGLAMVGSLAMSPRQLSVATSTSSLLPKGTGAIPTPVPSRQMAARGSSPLSSSSSLLPVSLATFSPQTWLPAAEVVPDAVSASCGAMLVPPLSNGASEPEGRSASTADALEQSTQELERPVPSSSILTPLDQSSSPQAVNAGESEAFLKRIEALEADVADRDELRMKLVEQQAKIARLEELAKENELLRARLARENTLQRVVPRGHPPQQSPRAKVPMAPSPRPREQEGRVLKSSKADANVALELKLQELESALGLQTTGVHHARGPSTSSRA